MSNVKFTTDPLLDNEFLLNLTKSRNKETFARITALTWEETPVEYIEGRITGGTINLDGTSIVRRTCSLSMIAQDINLNNFYWGLNSKIKIEIGLSNSINDAYPNIIWFPQGVFILTTFNTSLSVNNYSISLSAKDKMCMLNGDIGGKLNASIDFGVEEYIDLATNTITYYKIPIKDIIKNAVHVYGNEPLHNIIITDIDDYGYELLNYKGDVDNPLFLFKDEDSGIYTNMTMNKKQPCYYQFGNSWIATTIDDAEHIDYYDRVDSILSDDGTTIRLKENGKNYKICKIITNETVGYRFANLTYAGDLISNIGDSLTSILDKIKNMLGNFEYFYDIHGRFIFQKKRNNIYNNWNPLMNTDDGVYVNPYASSIDYSFYDSYLFTSISHTPDLANLKNDFSIWGVRKGVTGADIPVHMRYAIDRKPERYTSITITDIEAKQLKYDYGFETVKSQIGQTYTTDDYDWREIIYQMSLDYFAYSKLDDFVQRVAAANPLDYPLGYTGYEIYYTDIQGFWRQLYNPFPTEEDKNNYFIDTLNNTKYWHKDVVNNPSALNFWFDFIGEGSGLDQYLIPAIGDRAKVINDKDISAIYFKEVPEVLFITNDEYNLINSGQFKSGYTYIRINNSLNGFFSISSQGKSAHDTMEELLYENTYCSETINITSIPIYYLQPNTRVDIKDSFNQVNGEYIISRISLPLTYNGTMQITATKSADTIY